MEEIRDGKQKTVRKMARSGGERAGGGKNRGGMKEQEK